MKSKPISVSCDYAIIRSVCSLEQIHSDFCVKCSIEEGIVTMIGSEEEIKEVLGNYALLHIFDFENPAYEDMEAVHFVATLPFKDRQTQINEAADAVCREVRYQMVKHGGILDNVHLYSFMDKWMKLNKSETKYIRP